MSPIVHNKTNPQPRRRQVNDEDVWPTVILNEEADAVVGVCDGPRADGSCPWSGAQSKVECAGTWVVSGGWPFKVAEDAIVCPVASLGLATFGKE